MCPSRRTARQGWRGAWGSWWVLGLRRPTSSTQPLSKEDRGPGPVRGTGTGSGTYRWALQEKLPGSVDAHTGPRNVAEVLTPSTPCRATSSPEPLTTVEPRAGFPARAPAPSVGAPPGQGHGNSVWEAADSSAQFWGADVQGQGAQGHTPSGAPGPHPSCCSELWCWGPSWACGLLAPLRTSVLVRVVSPRVCVPSSR